MFHDDGRKMTLCGILKRIAEKTTDEEIRVMANDATIKAKKIDTKLKMYAGNAKKIAHEIEKQSWQ